jgi:ribonuclease Y
MYYLYAILMLLGLLAGFSLFWLISMFRKNTAVSMAARIKNDAQKEYEHITREAKVSAKSEVLKLKEAFEDECKERRKELTKIEQRLDSREENLDKKLDVLESRYETLDKKEKELVKVKEKLAEKETELQQKIDQQIKELQRVSELDRETAKKMLLEKLDSELKHEAGIRIRDIQEKTKETADAEAQRILFRQYKDMLQNAHTRGLRPQYLFKAMK